jgi:hypothetical protein
VGYGDSTGGSLELAELIDKYGEFLVPDLRRDFGIDLRDLFCDVDPLSPRFVLAHIHNLDYDSAFVAEVRGGQQFRGWDVGRYQMARVIDVLQVSNYLFILANSDPKKRKPKPPDPYPIPDEIKRVDKPGSFAFIAKAHIAAVKKRKALTDASRQ